MKKLYLILIVLSILIIGTISVQAENPTVTAVKVNNAVEIDGQLTDAAWTEAAQSSSKTVIDNHRGGDFHLNDVAFFTYDDQYLYVGIVAYVLDTSALATEGANWGGGDGVEVCFKNDEGVIFSIQGFPSGEFNVTVPQGEADVDELAEGTKVAAEIGDISWSIEYAIPLADYGVEVESGKSISFNLGSRKEDTDQWTAWIGTGGGNWDVDNAGLLELIE